MDLQTTFKQLLDIQNKSDSIAGNLLTAIKDQKLIDIDAFNHAVTEAYKAIGWRVSGRAQPGDGLEKAPTNLTIYLSDIRGAYREGMQPADYATMNELRKALRAKRKPAEPAERHKTPAELKLVQVREEDRLVGALFHDVAAVWLHLPDDRKESMSKSLKRLLAKYKGDADLKQVG